MPKLKKALSVFLAIWLCVMLVTFTYTWVSRNWTPSIKSDDISVASSGALLISVLGDESAVYTEVSLNDVVGLAVDNSFVFRQVSSQDGKTFFWKDFSPTVTGDNPAVFYKVGANDLRKDDYIDTKFCLTLDDSLTQSKYIFIHPETVINYLNDTIDGPHLNKAIRISLTFDKEIDTPTGVQTVTETIILADLDDNESVINALDDTKVDNLYKAVMNDADGKDENNATALGYQTVYGLQYFNCGRTYFDMDNPFNADNYSFTRDESKALFKLNPGEQKWIDMRIWLEGQDENCVKQIAGEKFNLVLKFDSAYVE